MAKVVTGTVAGPGLNKAQALVLATEFWTAKGFREHAASNNRLVFRRNGYGTVKAVLAGIVTVGGPLASAPIELTVLVLIRPNGAQYDLRFELGAGHSAWSGALSQFVQIWVSEFTGFVRDWTRANERALQE